MDLTGRLSFAFLIVLSASAAQAQDYWRPIYARLAQEDEGYNYERPMIAFELPTTRRTTTTRRPTTTTTTTTRRPTTTTTTTTSTTTTTMRPTTTTTTTTMRPTTTTTTTTMRPTTTTTTTTMRPTTTTTTTTTTPPPPPPTMFPPRTSICVLVTAEGVTPDISGGVFVTQEVRGGPVVLSGTVQGLKPGLHGFHLHRDAAQGGDCSKAGPHFNPFNSTHGGPMDINRHAGDFGNIEANELGVAFISLAAPGQMLAVEIGGELGVIGRSLVIHENADDFGLGGDDESLVSGNAGPRLACCVIKNLPNSTISS